MNEQEQKLRAAMAQGIDQIGQAVAVPSRPRAREMRIEAMEGGFVVAIHDDWGNHQRRVVPDGDCLLSFVQKWAGEGQQGG